jgi:hypothetical protein
MFIFVTSTLESIDEYRFSDNSRKKFFPRTLEGTTGLKKHFVHYAEINLRNVIRDLVLLQFDEKKVSFILEKKILWSIPSSIWINSHFGTLSFFSNFFSVFNTLFYLHLYFSSTFFNFRFLSFCERKVESDFTFLFESKKKVKVPPLAAAP